MTHAASSGGEIAVELSPGHRTLLRGAELVGVAARWRPRRRPLGVYAGSGRPIRVASSATSAARSRLCSAHRGTL